MTAPNPQGSAYVAWTASSEAVPTGMRRLSGLSYALKDMFDVAGHTVSGGSPDWKADGEPAIANSQIVDQLQKEGASLVGMTVCDELFYSLTGANAHLGTPYNPRWPGHLPGGSSSGSAAAVASSTCDFAIGSDTGGSVRVPAAFCGTYGLRTTTGSISGAGAMIMAQSFDSVGWFAASAGILRLVGDVLLRGQYVEPQVRVAVASDTLGLVDDDVRSAFEFFVARAAAIFSDVDQASLYGGDDPASWVSCFTTIQAREITKNYGEWITRRKPSFSLGVRERIAMAFEVTENQYAIAQEARRTFIDRLRRTIHPGLVLLMPTAPCAPPLVGADEATLQRFRGRAMQLTAPAGLGGLPQLAIPVATDAGPLSVSLLGWPESDRTLMNLAVQLAPLIGR